MRHFKADVSHRIRRRQPSIFGVWWFRLLLAVGLVIIVGLVVGPPVAGWFWSGVTSPPATVVAPATLAAPRPLPPVEPVASAAVPRLTMPDSSAPSTDGMPPRVSGVAPEAQPTGLALTETGDADEPLPAPGRYRVQVGAFLDHRNADRLVDRLRNQNLEVVDSFIEQSRVRYRVIALPAEEEGVGELVERLRKAGFEPELLDEGAAVTGFVSLHGAVEAARELRKLEIATRLERQAGAASFRVVRVGEYATAAEAERLRTELAAQGLEGFVVRER